ncbi:hypothetical protein GCM10023189_13100 [Nibrella saemangeumensis]|uniref:Uncharacterized protein n=1 Tax=Nibrella saemangeumensis TaxID=1084526 RepID=A0ABP8MJ36_9BACT
MKTYLFSIVLSVLAITTAVAQSEDKVRNDVTYSTHNYKHPNKAAAARQWSSQAYVRARQPRMAANYKHPVQSPVLTSGLVIPHTSIEDAKRNYKMPHNEVAKPAPAVAVK